MKNTGFTTIPLIIPTIFRIKILMKSPSCLASGWIAGFLNNGRRVRDESSCHSLKLIDKSP
jgi:hypothetical protein